MRNNEKEISDAGGKINILNKGLYFSICGKMGNDEKILVASNFIDSTGMGVIVVTDTTFYSSQTEGAFSKKENIISLNKITSCSLSNTLGVISLQISEGTKQRIFKTVNNAEKIIEIISGIKNGAHENKEQSDIATELLKYKKMMDDGLITQDDYNKKKNQLLGI